MARTRNLKPSFFTNEQLAELPPLARLLFQGLWLYADCKGRLEDRPKRLKIEILPYDDCDVDDLLQQLATSEFIERYTVDGKNYISIPNFVKHQRPHPNEPVSVIPYPKTREKSRVTHDKSEGLLSGQERVALLLPSPFPSYPSLPSQDSGVMYEKPTLSSSSPTVGVFSENPESVPVKDEERNSGLPTGGKHSGKKGVGPPICGEAPEKPPSREAQIGQVFAYWQGKCAHPKATLGDKRHRAIEARLKQGYSVERLCLAVDGCRGSPMHQGQNDRNTVYDDIELICRDEVHCDQFIDLAEATQAVKAKPDHIARHQEIYDEFCREAEARNGNGHRNGNRPDAPADPGGSGTGDSRRDPARALMPGRDDRAGPEDG